MAGQEQAAAAVAGWQRTVDAAWQDQRTAGVRPAIIDGRLATDAPWAARLFVNGQENCSATIIAPKFILTAEHCVADPGTYTFHVGDLDQTKGAEATAVNITKHDKADLAIVELDHEVPGTYAPLGNPDAVAEGQDVQVYGWGATNNTEPESQTQSQLLKVADVEVSDTAGQDYRGGAAFTATRGDGITAGGDSGGPMFARAPDGSYVQVGVASTSDRNSTTNYTNVTQYRDWIKGVAGV